MVLARDSQVRLKDGRKLGFAEYGNAQGKPIFYFHGLPGSRLEARLAAALGHQLGIRIIAVDRPGFGLSDFQPHRRMVDWANDVIELADHLNIQQFSVLGVSGGGPYAVACACRIPERIARVGIVCGLGPCEVPGIMRSMMLLGRLCLTVGRYCQWPVSLASALVAIKIRRYPMGIIKRLAKICPRPDREVFQTTETGPILAESFQEAIRHGTRGSVWEILLCSRPWGLRLSDIEAEIHLWHGELDIIVPAQMGRHMAQMIPNCQASFLQDEGHYSLPVRHLSRIMTTLTS